MNWNTLVDGEPDSRPNPEANDKRVLVWDEQRTGILVRALKHLEDANPAGELRHVAQKLVSRLHTTSNPTMSLAEAGDTAIRPREGFVCFGGEEIEEVGHAARNLRRNGQNVIWPAK